MKARAKKQSNEIDIIEGKRIDKPVETTEGANEISNENDVYLLYGSECRC